MSKGLLETPIKELLPDPLRNDPDAVAMAEAVQPLLDAVTESIPEIEIYRRIDELPEAVLHLLAWENRILGAEWRLARTIQEKRALVKNSFALNRKRGTRWAVERVLGLLGLDAEIVEWWEEGATPGTFRIALLDVTERGFDPSEIEFLDDLVAAYKPLARHLASVTVALGGAGTAYAHGAVSFVTLLNLEPARVGDIDETLPVQTLSAASIVARIDA